MDTASLAKTLKQHGIRPTVQRLAVYDYLLSHRTHPSADTIFEALCPDYPAFSRTTVYNSLRALEDAGLIRTVTIDPSEQRFDGDFSDHGHCRCTVCGRLFDFAVKEDALSGLVPDGFAVEKQDVFFSGVCASCRETENAKTL